jgi:hypothetical protein
MEKKFKLNQFNELMNLNGYKRVTQDLIYQ